MKIVDFLNKKNKSILFDLEGKTEWISKINPYLKTESELKIKIKFRNWVTPL